MKIWFLFNMQKVENKVYFKVLHKKESKHLTEDHNKDKWDKDNLHLDIGKWAILR